VVVGTRDENPKIKGRGIALLRKAGIAVKLGVLKNECRKFNEVFLKYIQTRTPFVTLKWGQSLDAVIGLQNHAKFRVNDVEALIDSHRERAYIDAICCGVGTVLTDNPILKSEFNGVFYGRNPLRVVLDSNLRTLSHPRLHVLDATSPTLIFCKKQAQARRAVPSRLEVVSVASHHGGLNLGQVLNELGKRQITHLEVEGGATVLSSFIRQELYDKIISYISPRLLVSKKAVSLSNSTTGIIPSKNLILDSVSLLNNDVKVIAYPAKKIP
jgi:diaminohydroxyphosphoribosylaminopyrimidine deaminase/5-amino-6-(5-phosphoribosylamino)uracil reductase